MIDLLALKAELQADPLGLGYAAHLASGTDWKLAELLNAVRAGISIDRGVIPSYEIINATVPAEWASLSAANKQLYQTLTGAGQVDSQNANTRAAFLQMFAQGTATRAALAALVTRPGSRAEQLWGESVTVLQVSRALDV
jgi:hypothetical protein